MRIASPEIRRDRTPFIGRRREREQLVADLTGGAGLITLTGPSGIGKTRLARQIAGEVFDSFDGEGGIWFCSLAECKDEADLEAAVARALAIHLQPGDELARSIANRGPLLLILDNADPIASRSGNTVARWLERCAELQMIVTSLVPLGIPGEIQVELRSLEPADAVALYLDRAHRAWADRSFSGEETSEVQDLVRRLDRLPLAIELAAARVRILPPRTMLSMFEKRFELLRISTPRGQPPGPSPRRSSLFGALELTWRHLEPAEQLALARGAVFEGGFTAEAARAVLFDDPPKEESTSRRGDSQAPAILEALHRKSLLLLEEMDPPRYFLMESVKEYALRELDRMGGWDEAIRRHAAFFLGQCELEPAWNRRPESEARTRWLRGERENLIAIHQRFLQSEPSLAARAGIALAPLIFSEGQRSSEAELIAASLEAARRSQDPELILAALEYAYTAHFREGDFRRTRLKLEELIALAHEGGERALEAFTLSRLALLTLEEGDLEGSCPVLRRAVELSEELGHPTLEGAILLVQGCEAIERGAYAEAEEHLVRSVDLLRRHGQQGIAVNSLYNLGLALANQRRHPEARQVMEEAIEICQGLGYRPFKAHILSNLAKLDLAAGFLDEAEAAGERCLGIQRTLGNPYREGMALLTLGIVSLERGDLNLAAEQLGRAEELFRPYDSGRDPPQIRLFLSVLEAKRLQLDEAHRLLLEARSSLAGDPRRLQMRAQEFELLTDATEVLLDVAAARLMEESRLPWAEVKVEEARARLARLERARVSWPSYLPATLRLLRKEIADRESGAPPSAHRVLPLALTTDEDFDWFQVTGGERVDLRSRHIIRRIFAALVRARLDTPGALVDPHVLIQAGWPEVRNTAGFSPNRLHYGVWTLRDLGLRAIVQNSPDGYRLDPAVPILQVPAEVEAKSSSTAESLRERSLPPTAHTR